MAIDRVRGPQGPTPFHGKGSSGPPTADLKALSEKVTHAITHMNTKEFSPEMDQTVTLGGDDIPFRPS